MAMHLPHKDVRFTHIPLDYKKKEIRLLKIDQDPEPSTTIHVTLETVDFGAHAEAVATRDARAAELDAEGKDTNTSLAKSRPGNGHIEASQTISDSNILDFTALSYAWGAERPEYEILVTRGDCTGWLTVRQNLYDFLRQRRQEKSPLYWIDQICINQSDDEEKGHQVDQMAELYRSATTVDAWLGSGFEGSDRLMDLITLAGHVEHPQQHIPGFPASKHEQRNLAPIVHRFVNLSYWSRVWIIQELVLGKAICICIEDTRLPRTTFLQGWLELLDRFSPIENLEPELVLGLFHSRMPLHLKLGLIEDSRQDLSEQGWLNVVVMLQHSDCYNYKDRVFGAMGMVQPELRFGCDYSMEPQELLYMIISREMGYCTGLTLNASPYSWLNRHYISVAANWFEVLSAHSDAMEPRSVRRELMNTIVQQYADSPFRRGRKWQIHFYIWYEFRNQHSKAWRLAHVGGDCLDGVKERCQSGKAGVKNIFRRGM